MTIEVIENCPRPAALTPVEVWAELSSEERELFARIWTAWRDGYCDTIGAHTTLSSDRVRAHFEDQIATIRDPASYAVWLVPVVSGVVAS